MLKFATGPYFKRDEEDEDDPYGGNGYGRGFNNNNPIL